jgi:hypothetical protein
MRQTASVLTDALAAQGMMFISPSIVMNVWPVNGTLGSSRKRIMTSDLEEINRLPMHWLASDVTYSGWGKAEFTDPLGMVEGPAVVHVNRFGAQRVTIDVKTPPAQGILFYIKGSGPLASFRRLGFANPCASVTVTTSDGLFSATERILFDGGNTRSKPHRIRLRLLRSQFEASGNHKAAYWVLPLSNFILSRWPRLRQNLDAHPLRISKPIRLCASLPAEQRSEFDRVVVASDHLVLFSLNGQPGFIEALPNYDKLVEQLTKGRIANAVNAVMVGPAHVESVSFSDSDTLFPLDVLPLLTMATGVRVGAPWVEFRDDDARLVRRVHIQFGSPPFEHGIAALPDFFPQAGLEELLTCMFSNSERGKNYLRVAMNRAINVSMHSQTLEDRFVSLVRAFETLFHHYDLSTQDLMTTLEVSRQIDVKSVLATAAEQIKALGIGETDPGRRGALERIEARVRNAANREKAFGLAMIDLLQRFALPDADVLQTHLDSHAIAGTTTWAGLLSKLRGAVTHEAYFELPSGQHDLEEILMVMDHLHDLLLRLLFKILGYKGLYQPPIPPLPRFAQVDWVTATTHAALLGYH